MFLKRKNRIRIFPKGKFIDIDSFRLHYLDEGEGEDWIFLHGFLVFSYIWEELFRAISKKGLPIRRIAVDLPGCGFSSRNIDFSYSFEGIAQLLIKFIDRVTDRKPITLVGHSMGGGIATILTTLSPESIKRLILIDTIGFYFKEPKKAKPLNLPFLGRYIFKYLYNKTILRNYFYNDIYYRKESLTEEKLEMIYTLFDERLSREITYKQYKEIIEKKDDILDYLKKIKDKEILIIWGEKDRIFPVEKVLERVKVELPKAKIEVIEGVGHSPIEEAPKKLVDLFSNYFKKIK